MHARIVPEVLWLERLSRHGSNQYIAREQRAVLTGKTILASLDIIRERENMKRLLVAVLAVVPLALSASAQQSSCLIVTSAEGHRFRNAMIAGALTGGIGLAAGAAFSGGRYEYRDSVNL